MGNNFEFSLLLQLSLFVEADEITGQPSQVFFLEISHLNFPGSRSVDSLFILTKYTTESHIDAP